MNDSALSYPLSTSGVMKQSFLQESNLIFFTGGKLIIGIKHY